MLDIKTLIILSLSLDKVSEALLLLRAALQLLSPAISHVNTHLVYKHVNIHTDKLKCISTPNVNINIRQLKILIFWKRTLLMRLTVNLVNLILCKSSPLRSRKFSKVFPCFCTFLSPYYPKHLLLVLKVEAFAKTCFYFED